MSHWLRTVWQTASVSRLIFVLIHLLFIFSSDAVMCSMKGQHLAAPYIHRGNVVCRPTPPVELSLWCVWYRSVSTSWVPVPWCGQNVGAWFIAPVANTAIVTAIRTLASFSISHLWCYAAARIHQCWHCFACMMSSMQMHRYLVPLQKATYMELPHAFWATLKHVLT